MANNTTHVPIKPPKITSVNWKTIVQNAGYPFPKGKEPSYEFRNRTFRQGESSGPYDGNNS